VNTTIERAREIARGIDSGVVWVDADVADEIAGLLLDLAATIETQCENVNCIEFALNYYSEPDLYHNGVAFDDVILDGGLRARTALGLIRRAPVTETARTPAIPRLSLACPAAAVRPGSALASSRTIHRKNRHIPL
jgi:hypothetical protein